jgi:hypothetical protein
MNDNRKLTNMVGLAKQMEAKGHSPGSVAVLRARASGITDPDRLRAISRAAKDLTRKEAEAILGAATRVAPRPKETKMAAETGAKQAAQQYAQVMLFTDDIAPDVAIERLILTRAVSEGDAVQIINDLLDAAQAPEGQPCADCGALVIYTDENGWRHVNPDTHCFLA